MLAALAASWPVGASAYRPFDSTDAAVADRGTLELELGPAGWRRRGTGDALVAPSAVLNWGFAEGWELVAEGRNVVPLGGEAGERVHAEDAAISVKRVLREGGLQDGPGPSVATELGALLPEPNGDPGLGAQWALIVSQRWPDLTVHVNGAAAWTRAHEPGASGGIIVEGPDAWTVRPAAEVLVEIERGSATTVSGLAGAIWRLREGLSLDAGLRRARAGRIDTTEVRLGLTWTLEVGGAHSARSAAIGSRRDAFQAG